MFDCDQVQTQIEAYLIGFLYADGYITNFTYNKWRALGISLQERDKDFLQNICDIFNSNLSKNYSLKYQSKTKSYKLMICDCSLVQRIIKLGVIPHKTYQNSDFVFTNIPDELKSHFIRGFFDGDGTIYKNKNRKYGAGFVSLNNSLLNSMLSYIKQYTGTGSIRVDKKYTRINFSGNPSVLKFGEFIYKDSEFYMERKKKEFDQIPIFQSNNVYKGISKYHNKIKVTYKHSYIGLFDNIQEALEAYNKEAIKNNDKIQEYKGDNIYYE